MSYEKKYWVIDDVVKPEDANRWEEGIAGLDARADASDGGTTIIITSENPPSDLTDYYIEFIATEDYVNTKPLVIDGVTFTNDNIKDIQQKALKNGAWAAGAPIRMRILNGTLFLTGGGGGSAQIHIGNYAPSDPTILFWFDTNMQVLKCRTTEGSVTWLFERGTFQAN